MTSSPIIRLHHAPLLGEVLFSTKRYIYGHYKHEHENALHDSFHEGDLLYSGPVKGNAEYTVEVRYTDYFSGDRSWFGTGYLTFKY